MRNILASTRVVMRAISLDGEVEARLLTFVGDREAIRERAAQEALAALHRRLVGTGG
jgi:nicotinamide mononucleotide (NMN) deamidase PncC